jgi:hypothetical protein
MEMREFEVLMLKWLLVAGLLMLGVGSTSAHAETMSLEDLERAYGNYEASCQNMTLVKSESAEAAFSGKVTVLPFDVEQCRRILKPIQINDIMKPLFLMVVKSEQTSISKLRIVRAVRRLVEQHRQKNMVRSMHVNAQPLANACAAVVEGRESNANLMCYYGGPTSKSGNPFKAIYQAMLDHTLPDLETICSPEPITSKTASTTTFSGFLTEGAIPLTWDELQTSLKSDGFQCGQDHCQRNILGIVSPIGKMSNELVDKSGANGKPAFGIIPRYLEIFRGDWHVIGPHGHCLIDANGKEEGDCSRPDNGVQNGICLASEDWHVWLRVVDAMNAFRHE